MATVQRETRIVIADDHPIFREGLRRLIDAEPGFRVVAEATDGVEAMICARQVLPDVLLLDLAMPRVGGLQVLRELREEQLPVRIILLTARIDPRTTVEALEHGARGVVLKESATLVLYKCLRAVMDGQLWVGQEQMAGVVDIVSQHQRRVLAPPPASMLTPRELQIVAAIVEGATNREVSERFGLSEQTVKNHLSHIFDKVGVSTRLELALYALHHRLLKPE